MISQEDYVEFLRLSKEKLIKSSDKFTYQCSKCKQEINRRVRAIKKSPEYCEVCAGKKIVAGVNDLKSVHPRLSLEYSSENSTPSNQVHCSSNQESIWSCTHCGGTWEGMSVAQRSKQNQGCPYCSNRRLLKGFNDLKSRFPKIIKEQWDSEKNNLDPSETLDKAKSKYWWRCSIGHSYQRELSKELTAKSCPLCKQNTARPNINDFLIERPELKIEWSNKNSTNPRLHTRNSSHVAYWTCSNSHTYQASIQRKFKGLGKCPYCTNRKFLRGFNDLKTKSPSLASEWDYSKNSQWPEDIQYGSSQKYWWKCSKGHSWEAQLSIRISQNTQCPKCKQSNLENEVFQFLKSVQDDFQQNDRTRLQGIEIDTYSPGLQLGVEINGDFWHSDHWIRKTRGQSAEQYHSFKKLKAKEAGIILLFVWESDWKNNREQVEVALLHALTNRNDIDPILHQFTKGC